MTKRQRNQLFYQSINKVVEKTLKELYIHYIRKLPESNHFSFGTFLTLKVFYKPLHRAHEQLSAWWKNEINLIKIKQDLEKRPRKIK